MESRRQAGNGLVVLLVILIVIVAIVTLGIMAMRRQPGQPGTDAGANLSASPTRGVSLSPTAYTASGLYDFFTKAKQLGIVEWQGDWQELGEANTGAAMVINNASKYAYTPILVVTAFKDAGASKLAPIRTLNATQADSYIAEATAFAKQYKPRYFGVGVEVNRIYESSPSDYQAFVSLFNRTVTAVHQASTGTQVFTTFQYERLQGLRGGLYGGINDPNADNWRLLDDFAAADLIGFSTYPGIVYKTPSDMPSNYYQAIAAHTTKPIAFTEIGWPAADEAAGWPSNSEAQNTFLEAYIAQTADLPAKFSIWSFLYDQQVKAPFDSLGLYDVGGNARPAWQTFSR